MTVKPFLDGKVVLHPGDCREVLATLPEASVDAIVCDPPYGLEFMGKDWDSFTGAGMTKPGIGDRDTAWPSFTGTNKTRCRKCGHLVGQGGSKCKCEKPEPYNAAMPRLIGFQNFMFEVFSEALRVLKPGGHLVAFSGTRTYHRMACAIEDAGFEIRDQLAWAYGSGFPKSLDVSKAIDKAAGAEREKIAVGAPVKRMIPGADQNGTGSWVKDNGREYQPGIEIPATDAARQWQGWGTALKPAWEPICLARKPLIGTVAANVLAHGTGALNIDGCRVGTSDALGGGRLSGATPVGDGWDRPWMKDESRRESDAAAMAQKVAKAESLGRWPANIIHDGSEEVTGLFPETGISSGGSGAASQKTALGGHVYGQYSGATLGQNAGGLGDAGSAARFFYTSKADAEDRLGSKHPTVKPVDLMQWLVRLVCPKGGVVLDPFAGTGTTGEAAWREGMRAILIEREPEYQEDIARRMDLAAKPTKRAAVAKTKNKLEKAEDLPLFGGDA